MKPLFITTTAPPEVVVHIEDVEKPVPDDDEVLIRVRAGSVNPLDEGVHGQSAVACDGPDRARPT
jgi:NADPH:quinone reductase-like Zn-dependent oxidoreductase